MKQKLLIITINSTTKNALKNYLTSLLSHYIYIEACLAHQVTYEIMKEYDLVLLSSEITEDTLSSAIRSDIPYLISERTFNHTYLNKILLLPPGVNVYLVNDSKQTSETVIEQLTSFGISQYNFVPYYPGCGDADLSIHYAVTVGELKLVPPHISSVIDIGNRIVDISTIIEIIVYFNLPMNLVDEVTKNHLNHIVQILKLTNSQLNEAINTKTLNQSIINNVSTGLCLLDVNGFIKLVNPSFVRMLSLKVGNLIDTSLNIHIQKYDISFDWKTQINKTFYIKNLNNEIIKLYIQDVEDNKQNKFFLVHSSLEVNQNILNFDVINEMNNNFTAMLSFKDFLTVNQHTKKLLEAAKRISLTDYPVLIQGENGTGKSVLAQSIHNNSIRSQQPYVTLNISTLTEEILECEFLGYIKRNEANEIIEEKPSIFEYSNKGTLYLEGIHDLPYKLQCLLERIMEKKVVRRLGSNKDFYVDVRIITSSSKDLFSFVSKGLFRGDLFYNLNVVSLETIPLRNRREDIPLYFHNSLKNVYNNSNLSIGGICSESLRNFLLAYSWPGNVKEINNLCKYFSCIQKHEKLLLRDLPGYLQNILSEEQESLSLFEKQILHILKQNPKIGRSRIQKLLSIRDISISEGKIRGLLQSLSEKGLIKMNRTKGGCEITEEGELYI